MRKLCAYVLMVASLLAFTAGGNITSAYAITNQEMSRIEPPASSYIQESGDYYISDENLVKLEALNNVYGIKMHLDGIGIYYDEYDFATLPEDKINKAIALIYDTLQLLGTDAKTIEIIRRSCDDVYNVCGGGFFNVGGSKRILISYDDDYSNEYLAKVIVAEISDTIINNNGLSLDKFRSYNGFDKYKHEGGTWLDDYRNMTFEGDERSDYVGGQMGLLTISGYDNENDDMNSYFRGLVLADYAFWDAFYFYERIRNKTMALIDELSRVNPLWTLEFFSELSNPYDYNPADLLN